MSRFWGTNNPEIGAELDASKPDAVLVMGWFLRCYWQTLIACRRRRLPVMVRGESQLATPRNLIKQKIKEVAYPFLFKSFRRHLFIGERNRDYLRSFGVGDERMSFSPYSVDNVWFSERAATVLEMQDDDVERVRAAAAGRPIALFCGKLINKKRPLDFLRALIELKQHGRPVHALVVGSGMLKDELERLAVAESISFSLVGFQNQTQLPRWYVLADLLVLPSDGGETWGLVVNEAMACGTPAVVSDAVGCGPDMIDEGQTGAVARLGDIGDLADAVGRSLDLKRRAGTASFLASKLTVYSLERAAHGIIEGLEICGSRSPRFGGAKMAQ